MTWFFNAVCRDSFALLRPVMIMWSEAGFLQAHDKSCDSSIVCLFAPRVTARRYAVVEQIDQIMIQRRKIERFIEAVKDLPELITEFDESLWAALVDSMTVYAKDRIVFRLTCGMEIEV